MESSDAYDGISEGYREIIKEYSMLLGEPFKKVDRRVMLFAEFLKGLGEGGIRG